MATKKKSLLPADLDLDAAQATPGAGRPQPPFHERPTAPPEPTDDARGLKEKAVATTLYLLPDDHRRLRRMAIDRDVSFQTLMLDAIDLLLAREGEEPVGRWETRRKVR